VVIVPSLPIDIDGQPPRAGNARTDVVLKRPEPQQPLAKSQAEEISREGRRIHRLPSSKSTDLPFSPLPEALNVHGPRNP
jgi:hypothetical protein